MITFYPSYTDIIDRVPGRAPISSLSLLPGEPFGVLAAIDLTWYPCCFPKTLNTFYRSPLMESRRIRVITYLMGMKGMLRWAYGIFTAPPFSPIYKTWKWPAGDMGLIYPGRFGGPDHSLREKNLFYGIWEYNLFSATQSLFPDFSRQLKQALSLTKPIKRVDEDVAVSPVLFREEYLLHRNRLLLTLYSSKKNTESP